MSTTPDSKRLIAERLGQRLPCYETHFCCASGTATKDGWRAGPLAFLQEFSGYLPADAFAGYEGIYAARAVQQVLCWAHARRKFYEAKAAHPESAHQALAFIAWLYDLERAAKGWSPDERPALRRERNLPILQQFHTWLEMIVPRVLPESPLGRAIG